MNRILGDYSRRITNRSKIDAFMLCQIEREREGEKERDASEERERESRIAFYFRSVNEKLVYVPSATGIYIFSLQRFSFSFDRLRELSIPLPAMRTGIHEAVQLEEAHEMGMRRETPVSVLLLQLQFHSEDEPTPSSDRYS